MYSLEAFLSLKIRKVKLDSSPKDKVIPTGKWTFDESVAEVFDDMLERSIPDYLNMRNLVDKLIIKYCKENSNILDLGCSTGGAFKNVIPKCHASIKFIGVEISEPMRKLARQNLQNYIDNGRVSIVNNDLRLEFPESKNSIVLSILTLQFVPIEYRQKIIREVYNSLNPGGVFIYVEKILGDDLIGNQVLEDLYYEMKGENSYSEEQIKTKRKSLEGVLVPVTSRWNEDLIMRAGFSGAQKFWQQLNFAGWIAFKNE